MPIREHWDRFRAAALGRRTRPRILALLAFHDERRYLSGYFRNVSPHVDGILALDDGSTDGSAEIAEGAASVLELVRRPPRTPHAWDEPANRRLLFAAAARHRPDWLIALDADERIEKNFRARAEAEIARARAEGIRALSVQVRDLWNSPETYRVDGLWGQKRTARLFEFRRDAEIDPRAFHGHWAPLNSRTADGFPPADLYLYHLRMIDPDARRARRERYERLDPGNLCQAIGYGYLTDEEGLRLERLPAGREYEPLGIGT